jgi:Ca2+-binding EF-hand superfamily protein
LNKKTYTGTDEESVILNAFKLFDPNAAGHINSKSLREVMCHQGRPDERLTEQEFNQVLEGAPIDKSGNLDYANFTKIIKRGKQDDE